MAVTITIEEVRDGFDTAAGDTEVQMAIDFVSTADECLDANEVPDNTQRALKLQGTRHMLAMQAGGGRGEITSQTAPSGASQSYGKYAGDYGTSYGETLRMMDKTRCVSSLFDNLRDAYATFTVVR